MTQPGYDQLLCVQVPQSWDLSVPEMEALKEKLATVIVTLLTGEVSLAAFARSGVYNKDEGPPVVD